MIRSLRQECRRAERKWKKDKLPISYIMLRDALTTFQEAAKMARANYFSEIIVKYSHQPCVLFDIINFTLEPSVSVCLESSVANFERF